MEDWGGQVVVRLGGGWSVFQGKEGEQWEVGLGPGTCDRFSPIQAALKVQLPAALVCSDLCHHLKLLRSK